MRDIWHKYHSWYFKIVSNFTRLTAREIMYNDFEISLVVFMPNITTNHAITYIYYVIHAIFAFYIAHIILDHLPAYSHPQLSGWLANSWGSPLELNFFVTLKIIGGSGTGWDVGSPTLGCLKLPNVPNILWNSVMPFCQGILVVLAILHY